LIIRHQQSLDNFHKNAREIFAINEVCTTNGVSEYEFQSPLPLAIELKANSPLITSIVRMHSASVITNQGAEVFHENIRLVDEDFFRMFSFELRQGNADALKDPSGVVLSDEAAKKYFGNSDALGKQLLIIFNDSLRRTFTVTAIAAPFPDNASFSFGLLTNISVLKELGKDDTNWKPAANASFVQLNSPASKAQVAALLNKFTKEYNTANPDNQVQSFYLDNLIDIARHGYYTRNALAITSPPAALYILSILAIMVLSMSCFNFTNYALATSTKAKS
jgi:putative ABC transport system permease protein